MSNQIFSLLAGFEQFLWSFLGVPIIVLLGLYFSFRSNFVQIRCFPSVIKTFVSFFKVKEPVEGPVHPLKAFFACIGGCVGIGNVVAICSAVQIGGPGALLWIWLTAIFGMILKYCEVYLGIRYRVKTEEGYDGGPHRFLRKVFKKAWIPNFVSILLCIYGIEIYQFSIITESLVQNFDFNQYLVVGALVSAVLFAGLGGVRRVGSISSAIIPVFVVLYVGMGLWVFFQNLDKIPGLVNLILSSAFSGHAAMGGFVGSTLMLTISQGVRRGCYTSDFGVGYASVIHSETTVKVPEKQASLVIFDVFIDAFLICTTSIFLILVTGVWHQPIGMGLLVQTALSQYFPYMHYFMPFFLLLLGYSTINAYFCVGLKCAAFVSPKFGKLLYCTYAAISFVVFAFFDSTFAQSVMTVAGGLLLVINSYAMYYLRDEISFKIEPEEEKAKTILDPA